MTSPALARPSLASFWNDLPRDGKLLLSTVAVETLGTGLVLPFGFIYLHEVRGFTIETAGTLLAVPAIVGMAVVGPAGALIDRLGARRIILAGMTAQMLGNALSFLAPLAVLLGPLRHVSGKVDHPVSELDGSPVRTSYLNVLRDRAMVPVIALTFLSAFVGYAQMEAGFTAYARLVGQVSTRTIGYAFAANTVTIVLLQLLVLQRIEGRRRTRVILVLSALWALSWLMTGLSGLVPGSSVAAVLIIGSYAVFALGETLLQPTIPAITNDLSPDHLRGRYNAVMAGAFQLAAVAGPVVAGVMLGARFNAGFIGMLVLGCAAMALIAFAVEHRIPARANGISTPAMEPSEV
ncbi:MAG TPA: MFS transporter [Dermatophilaceae bacterium]